MTGRILAIFLVTLGLSGGSVLAHRIPVTLEELDAAEAARDVPSIEEDVAALDHFHARGKKAARRLAERGPEILDELHQALADPAAGVKRRIQLMTVLAQIGHPDSTAPIVAAANAAAGETGVRREALRSLAELPASSSSAAFATRVLDDPASHPLLRRDALVYFAQQRDPQGADWLEANPDLDDADLSAAALYLRARLGDPTVLEPLTDRLRGGVSGANRYGLLLGLAELTDPAEFERRLPPAMRETEDAASVRRILTLKAAPAESRVDLATEMLGADRRTERKAAVSALIAAGEAPRLSGYLHSRVPPQVRIEVRHGLQSRGYRVRREKGELKIVREAVP